MNLNTLLRHQVFSEVRESVPDSTGSEHHRVGNFVRPGSSRIPPDGLNIASTRIIHQELVE